MVAVVVLALSVSTLSGCKTDDERAYSIDTGDMSLDEGLELYGLGMPDCPVQKLRYALVGMWGGHDFYLRFSTDAACMNSFLDINDLVDIGEAASAEPFPHGHPKLSDVGWTFREGVSYRMHHPRDFGGRDLVAVIDSGVDPQVVSIYGFPV
ncbi:hypothetical protein [Micromonospora avicenniae]|uniref:hypothetical protein n=1 Tax=Micromonospora avicenniae TaxID=1198245 RepID=UPI00332749BD